MKLLSCGHAKPLASLEELYLHYDGSGAARRWLREHLGRVGWGSDLAEAVPFDGCPLADRFLEAWSAAGMIERREFAPSASQQLFDIGRSYSKPKRPKPKRLHEGTSFREPAGYERPCMFRWAVLRLEPLASEGAP